MNNILKRKSYIWNTISGMINAGQSALILIFISYRYSMKEAGIFSIAYAISLLGMTLSKYGQRNFQVTDINEEFSFTEYCNSRIVTVIVTMLIIAVYLGIHFLTGEYDLEKMLSILLICFWKQIDSIEDVYYGMYQQHGRLDIGAKRYSERLIFSTGLFCLFIMVRLPFVITILLVVLLSVGVALILLKIETKAILGENSRKNEPNRSGALLKTCFSLCISSTAAVYIGNMPKYLIDFYLDDTVQAKFGYLMMPAFVIMVLSMIIFQPIVREMGEAVLEGDNKRLSRYIRKQLIYISIITGAVVASVGVLGIPSLNFLYNTNLTEYSWNLIVLLIGGGFYAVSQFMMVPIVSMRKQNDIVAIYAVVTVFSMLVGTHLVSQYEIWGACILYVVINVILSFFLICDYKIRIRQVGS